MYEEEGVTFRAAFPERNYNIQIHQDGLPAEPGGIVHEEWTTHTFVHKLPFITWEEFCDECRRYFLTTETREHVAQKLQELTQKEDVE